MKKKKKKCYQTRENEKKLRFLTGGRDFSKIPLQGCIVKGLCKKMGMGRGGGAEASFVSEAGNGT